jgi:glutaconate CoA-transferase subunit B
MSKRVGRIQEENLILQLYQKWFQCTKAPVHILDNMKFSVDVTEARPTPAPTAEELRILREQRDPQRLILGK